MAGNALTARHLLERGADPGATDLKGNTLLHAAADGGQAGMVSAFLALGVDPRRRNRAGQRPIDLARERGYDEVVRLLERFEKD
jgi:ankyrin repeat protein